LALLKEEESRVRALGRAAANWARAQQIRGFLVAAREEATRNGQPITPGTSFGDWLVWAEQQADRLDPLKESPPSIIDRKRDIIPERYMYYGYGQEKPKPPFRFTKPIWQM
jgi:hypothetical protein